MEQCHSWEADRCSPNHDIPRILWSPKVHYRAHNSRQLVPVLSQMNSVLTSTSHCFTIHFNITSPSMSRSTKRSISFTVLHQNILRILISSMHATLPTHVTLLELIIQLKCGDRWKSRKSSLCSFLQYPTTTPLEHIFLISSFICVFPSGREAILKAKVSTEVNGVGQLAWFLN